MADKRIDNNLFWKIVIILPLIGCYAVVFCGETSPRYSFPIQFVLAILSGVGLSGIMEFKRKDEKTGRSLFVFKKYLFWGLISIISYLIIAFGGFTVLSKYGKGMIFEDISKVTKSTEKGYKEESKNAIPKTLKPFEKGIIFKKGWIKNGDYEEILIPSSRNRGRDIEVYLLATANRANKENFTCLVEMNGERIFEQELSEFIRVKRIKTENQNNNDGEGIMKIRIIYEGEKEKYLNENATLLRVGYMSFL